MTRIIIPETNLEYRIRAAKERRAEERRRRELGLCITCGCKLATNVDQGILLCAHTHREQFEAYKRWTAEEAKHNRGEK